MDFKVVFIIDIFRSLHYITLVEINNTTHTWSYVLKILKNIKNIIFSRYILKTITLQKHEIKVYDTGFFIYTKSNIWNCTMVKT